MKHLKDRERFSRERKTDLSEYCPVGTKDCEGKCDRNVVMTKDGPVIVCNACKRVVMDNRK